MSQGLESQASLNRGSTLGTLWLLVCGDRDGVRNYVTKETDHLLLHYLVSLSARTYSYLSPQIILREGFGQNGGEPTPPASKLHEAHRKTGLLGFLEPASLGASCVQVKAPSRTISVTAATRESPRTDSEMTLCGTFYLLTYDRKNSISESYTKLA